MRHYLNTDLKGKEDVFGLNRYSVYVMFAVNRQTFKIKSRILRKMFSTDEFEQLTNSQNPFLIKDTIIIRYCIEQNMAKGLLDIEGFKTLYAQCCTSISLWLEDYIINERQYLMDDFFFGSGLQAHTGANQPLSDLERQYGIDRRIVLGYLNRYSAYHSNTSDFKKYLLVYDWIHEDLRTNFTQFLNNSNGIPAAHSNVIPFIDSLIHLI